MGIMYKYERLEHDKHYRLSLHVFHDNRTGTQRVRYRYDNLGKKSFNLERTEEYNFWN